MPTGIGEIWKPVAVSGYEDFYEVSNTGYVRSKARKVQATDRVINYKERILKFNIDSSGYSQVCLCNHGKRKTMGVHKIVALTFIGDYSDTLEVCHNNGEHKDNRVENLRWDTRSNNTRDKIRHGTHNWLQSKGGVIPDDYYEGDMIDQSK